MKLLRVFCSQYHKYNSTCASSNRNFLLGTKILWEFVSTCQSFILIYWLARFPKCSQEARNYPNRTRSTLALHTTKAPSAATEGRKRRDKEHYKEFHIQRHSTANKGRNSECFNFVFPDSRLGIRFFSNTRRYFTISCLSYSLCFVLLSSFTNFKYTITLENNKHNSPLGVMKTVADLWLFVKQNLEYSRTYINSTIGYWGKQAIYMHHKEHPSYPQFAQSSQRIRI